MAKPMVNLTKRQLEVLARIFRFEQNGIPLNEWQLEGDMVVARHLFAQGYIRRETRRNVNVIVTTPAGFAALDLPSTIPTIDDIQVMLHEMSEPLNLPATNNSISESASELDILNDERDSLISEIADLENALDELQVALHGIDLIIKHLNATATKAQPADNANR